MRAASRKGSSHGRAMKAPAPPSSTTAAIADSCLGCRYRCAKCAHRSSRSFRSALAAPLKSTRRQVVAIGRVVSEIVAHAQTCRSSLQSPVCWGSACDITNTAISHAGRSRTAIEAWLRSGYHKPAPKGANEKALSDAFGHGAIGGRYGRSRVLPDDSRRPGWE
jgi:hypothetical protein